MTSKFDTSRTGAAIYVTKTLTASNNLLPRSATEICWMTVNTRCRPNGM